MEIRPLPRYVHTFKIRVERDKPLTFSKRFEILVAALAQFVRVGEVVASRHGPAAGDLYLEFDLATTCPYHDLEGATLIIEVSNSRRVDEG